MKELSMRKIRTGFVSDAVRNLLSEQSEAVLRTNFMEEWSDRIEELYQSYLTERALRREIEKNPFLATEIKDTDLPDWVKEGLIDLPWCLNTVLDVLQFTKAEIKNHRGVGERAMVIIENYLAVHGLQLKY